MTVKRIKVGDLLLFPSWLPGFNSFYNKPTADLEVRTRAGAFFPNKTAAVPGPQVGTCFLVVSVQRSRTKRLRYLHLLNLQPAREHVHVHERYDTQHAVLRLADNGDLRAIHVTHVKKRAPQRP